MSNRVSPAMKAQTMKATVLTNNLCLELSPIPPGGIVQISEQSSFNNQLYCTLEMPSIDAKADNMRLLRCLMVGSDYYCILSHPKPFDDDQPITSLMVAKVVDQKKLMAITEEDLQNVELACANAMKDGDKVKAQDVQQVLGDFPEYVF
jgi:hypothetical protein